MNISPLSLDECMSMTYSEVCAFLEQHKRLIDEGLIAPNQPHVDLENMSDAEIARKYNFTPIDVVKERIFKQFNSKTMANMEKKLR